MIALASIKPVAAVALRYWWVGGLVALGVLAGVRTQQRDEVRVLLAEETAARATDTEKRRALADEYKDKLAALKFTHETETQEKENAFTKDKAALVAVADARAADARSLQQRLTAATAPSRRASDPVDAATCQRDADRLAALGQLAGEGVGVVAEARSLLQQRDLEVTRLLDQIRIDRAACSPQSLGSTTQ